MGIKRRCVSMLDRPGGRWLLTAIGNRWARAHAQTDVGVRFDGLWLHRVGHYYLPDSPTFSYSKKSTREWNARLQKCFQESADYWFYAYKPQPGDLVIDVGAGVGTDTLLFSEVVGEAGRVYAIEAHPFTYQKLCKLVKWNRLCNVSTHRCAIADEERVVCIQDETSDLANAISLAPDPDHPIQGVPGLSLDQFCREQGITRIDFLKMNIEGAERLAIQGMEEAIHCTRNISVACHDFQVSRTADPLRATTGIVVDFLHRNGFSLRTRCDDRRPWVQYHVHGVRGA